MPLELGAQVGVAQVAVGVLLVHVERVAVVPPHEPLLARLLDGLRGCGREEIGKKNEKKEEDNYAYGRALKRTVKATRLQSK